MALRAPLAVRTISLSTCSSAIRAASVVEVLILHVVLLATRADADYYTASCNA